MAIECLVVNQKLSFRGLHSSDTEGLPIDICAVTSRNLNLNREKELHK